MRRVLSTAVVELENKWTELQCTAGEILGGLKQLTLGFRAEVRAEVRALGAAADTGAWRLGA